MTSYEKAQIWSWIKIQAEILLKTIKKQQLKSDDNILLKTYLRNIEDLIRKLEIEDDKLLP